MRRSLILVFLAATALGDSRTYEASYVATISDIPAGIAKVDVWVPLPQTSEHQTVSALSIDSPYAFVKKTEDGWGNVYAHAVVTDPPATIETRVRFTVTRDEARLAAPEGKGGNLERALKADRLVTLSPRIRKLADEVTAGKSSPLEQARAIYDHVVYTMTYDKIAPGWGAGDTERACDIRKGNCTDFHSLFMSLARAKGIPARFVIGFPMSAPEGVIAGYHCWAEFWLEGKGWIPVDASDAAKNAKLHDYLFGNLDAQRVQFTTGRDLILAPATSEPLNYFIHPRAEAQGAPVGTATIKLEFREK